MRYSKDVEDISDDCIAQFVQENAIDSFEDLYLEISNLAIKNICYENRRNAHLYKLILFADSCMINFPKNKFEIKTVITNNFLNDAVNPIFGDVVIHHSHVTDEIIDYPHNFYNKKMREALSLIPVFTHNLFSFDCFFVVKGIRFYVWRTKQLNIGGTNLTNVQYANMGDQFKFIETIKYYEQSLTSLALGATEFAKANIRQSC